MPSAASLQLIALLRQGFAAQQRGDAAAAEQAYRAVLAIDGEEPDAWQLLGVLAKQRGALDEAQSCWQRSLAARPEQPHVLNNLANLRWRRGDAEAAEAAWRRALALAPAFADAHYNLARMHLAQGRDAAASLALEEALRCSSRPTVGMLHLQASLAGRAGRLGEALALLDEALQQAPLQAALHHDRGVLLYRLHRYDLALQAHEHAAALGALHADAHYNRGNTLQSLGRLDDAVRAYRDALALDPRHLLSMFDLARLRWRRGEADFDAELLQAQERWPADATAPLVRADLLWRGERFGEALEAYREAARRGAGTEALDGVARCQVRLGDVEAGLAVHERALLSAPDGAALHVHHACGLLLAGRADQARQAARRALVLAPTDQYAWALFGDSLRAGDDPTGSRLVERPDLVHVLDIDAPAGFASVAAFLAALAQWLATLHHDRRAPIDQTLRQGTQTFGNLLDMEHPLARALREALAERIDAALAAWPDAATAAHPVQRRRRPPWRFTDSWSARLGPQGRHIDHVHPHGWLSAAFYVEVPGACADAQRREGWLRFGVPEASLATAPGLQRPPWLEVAPRPGRLVLFPSMFWHGTRELRAPGIRTTVSFDIVPADETAWRLPDLLVEPNDR